MKKIIITIISLIMLNGIVFADIDSGVSEDKAATLRDMKTWGLAEGYLKGAVEAADTNLANALAHYQLIDSNSIIYQIKDSEGNLIVPKTEMIQLYNALKDAIDAVKADYPNYLGN